MAETTSGQVVFDEVTLDGGTSIDGEYLWELKHRDNPDFDKVIVDEKNPLVTGLDPGLYDVTLTVTDEEDKVKHIAIMLLAAAGACEDTGGSLPDVDGTLHMWRFKIKKYKRCNWAFAKVFGTINASDLPLDNSKDQDGLEARVFLQLVDKDENIVGGFSGQTAVEIKDRRWKYVIRKNGWH